MGQDGKEAREAAPQKLNLLGSLALFLFSNPRKGRRGLQTQRIESGAYSLHTNFLVVCHSFFRRTEQSAVSFFCLYFLSPSFFVCVRLFNSSACMRLNPPIPIDAKTEAVKYGCVSGPIPSYSSTNKLREFESVREKVGRPTVREGRTKRVLEVVRETEQLQESMRERRLSLNL